MQDRFKVRAWDNEKKEFRKTYPSYIYSQCITNPRRYIVEQCTGLKDKNGKLIYEGDIVLVEDNKCPIEWESENARYNVVGYGEIAYLNYNDIEVIGNIHENPELLENKDESV